MFVSALGLFFLGLAVPPHHPSVEGLAVMVAVILATGVAFLSEYRSDHEFEVLNARKESLRVKVIRGGQFHTVAARRCRGRRRGVAGDGRRDPRGRPARQGGRSVRRSVAHDRRIGAGPQEAGAGRRGRRVESPAASTAARRSWTASGRWSSPRSATRPSWARSPGGCRRKRRKARSRPRARRAASSAS